MKKITVRILFVLVVMALSLPTFAHGRGGHGNAPQHAQDNANAFVVCIHAMLSPFYSGVSKLFEGVSSKWF